MKMKYLSLAVSGLLSATALTACGGDGGDTVIGKAVEVPTQASQQQLAQAKAEQAKADQAKIDELNTKINNLNASLEQSRTDLKNAQNALAAEKQKPSADPAELARLQNQLEQAQNRLKAEENLAQAKSIEYGQALAQLGSEKAEADQANAELQKQIEELKQRISELQANNDTGDNTQPGTGDNTQPGTGDNTQPGTGDNTQPGTGDNTQPGTGDNTQPGTGDNTQPGTGDNTQPGTGDNTQPGTGDNTQPGTGDNTQPGTGDNTQPGTGDNTQPGTGDNTQPGTGDNTQPGTGDNTQPGTGDNTQPGTGDNTQPKNPSDAVAPVNDNKNDVAIGFNPTVTPSVGGNSYIRGSQANYDQVKNPQKNGNNSSAISMSSAPVANRVAFANINLAQEVAVNADGKPIDKDGNVTTDPSKYVKVIRYAGFQPNSEAELDGESRLAQLEKDAGELNESKLDGDKAVHVTSTDRKLYDYNRNAFGDKAGVEVPNVTSQAITDEYLEAYTNTAKDGLVYARVPKSNPEAYPNSVGFENQAAAKALPTRYFGVNYHSSYNTDDDSDKENTIANSYKFTKQDFANADTVSKLAKDSNGNVVVDANGQQQYTEYQKDLTVTPITLQHVQYGRVSSILDAIDNSGKVKLGTTVDADGNPAPAIYISSQVVAPNGTSGADSAQDPNRVVNTYFYRGIGQTELNDMQKVFNDNKDAVLTYRGHALTYGLTDGITAPFATSTTNGGQIPTGTVGGNVNVEEKYNQALGSFVQADLNTGTGKVSGDIFNVQRSIGEEVSNAKAVSLISFNGDVKGNTVIGNATRHVDALARDASTTGNFRGTFYGSQAEELGGAVNAVDTYGKDAWGAVFGAQRDIEAAPAPAPEPTPTPAPAPTPNDNKQLVDTETNKITTPGSNTGNTAGQSNTITVK
ncbi:transferrin-binding protein-like solute binding protein [Faucicola atlantae]|uniref:transferrin-binding protein-like solute binding protein n=1 Tax=Faucicola atlantae TaxID=34059 RepID=UPI0025AFDC35|nr:transferrin-binding protein-like solute binding protein [Moraxella atlantae]